MVLKMKNRLISEIKKLALIGCAGGIYGIWILITGRYIPCLFNELTGLECPGCGVSHMAMALFRLDFREAFECNPFLFVIIPIIALMYIADRSYYVKNGVFKKWGMVWRVTEYSILTATIVFWIARNVY